MGKDYQQQNWMTQAYLAEQARRQQQLRQYQIQNANNALQQYGIDKNAGLGAAQLAQNQSQFNQNRSDAQLKSFVSTVGTGLAAHSTSQPGGGDTGGGSDSGGGLSYDPNSGIYRGDPWS